MKKPILIESLGRDEKSVEYGLFQCECGKIWKTRVSGIKHNHVKSCGCAQRKAVTETGRKNTKHGKSNISEYYIWATMKARCLNSNNYEYHLYGGRGITVCERWLNSFENFYKDMGPRPSKKHSIERMENDKNYEPSNCKWSTGKEQSRNTRRNRKITFNNETKTLIEWSEITGLYRGTIQARIDYYGWTVEEALTKSKMKNQHG